MNPQRIAVATAILTKCSSFDNRRPDPATVASWAEALDEDITIADGIAIVTSHYANSRDWIMPFDVNAKSRMIRKQRIAQVLENRTPIPDGLGDEPHLEIAWQKRLLRAVGDGEPLDEAEATAWRSIGRTPPPQLPASSRPLTLPRLRKA